MCASLFCLTTPGNFAVDRPSNSNVRARSISEFCVKRLQKILSGDGKLEAPVRPQTQAGIGRAIGPDSLCGQGADVSVGKISLNSFGQIEERLNLYFVGWT